MKRIAIIGGGASGMTAALSAAEEGAFVVLFEHNDRLGKKLAATGNGRCNLGNSYLDADCYRGGDVSFVSEVFGKCSPEQVRVFLSERGLSLKERNGYFYPRSEQARSVIDFFTSRLSALKVTVLTGCEVTEVIAEKAGFTVSFVRNESKASEDMQFDSVILATGGLAGNNLGVSAFGYDTARSFGHTITPLFPALVQLVTNDKNKKTLSGVRTEANVTVSASFGGHDIVKKETGEVLFTDYGISGIPVMQLSRYAGEALQNVGTASLSLDLMPEYTFEKLFAELKERRTASEGLTIEQGLTSILQRNLLYVTLLRASVEPESYFSKASDETLKKLCAELKNFRLTVTGTKDFSAAQVTAGGIRLGEIRSDTMESKLKKGLYITGELLDVDGTCGGYNLQFAFATGILAGRAAAGREMN